MIAQWKIAALGALGGAVIAVAVVFGAAAIGMFPQARGIDGRQLHAYLIAHPQWLAEITDKLQEQQDAEADAAQQAAMRAVGQKALFDTKVAFVTGPAAARNTVAEFFDYNCVHCRNTLPAFKAFYEMHRGDTRFAFIDFPIFGAASNEAARAAVAARRQPDKYVAFYFALMGEKSAINTDVLYADAKAVGLDIPKLIADMKDPAVDATLAAAHALAGRLHVNGTPTFVVNGTMRAGEIDPGTLRDLTKAV